MLDLTSDLKKVLFSIVFFSFLSVLFITTSASSNKTLYSKPCFCHTL